MSFSIGETKVYTAKNIRAGVLPVSLAGIKFDLPIKEEGGVKFAWLDPSGKDLALRQACGVEIGIRLARKTKDSSGVVILPPSNKSTKMAEMAVRMASGLTGREMVIIKAGGGLTKDREEFLPGSNFEFPDIKIGEVTAAARVQTDFKEEAWVVRYMPVTGKDKLMYLTATQWTQMQIAVQSGVLITCEDVVSRGTTIEALKKLLEQVNIRKSLQIIAVAREGESYKGQMDYAIQIPAL